METKASKKTEKEAPSESSLLSRENFPGKYLDVSTIRTVRQVLLPKRPSCVIKELRC
jgi:hypothetical protein